MESNVTYKKDFMRSWTHSRTAKHISIGDLMENGKVIDGKVLYEIADPVENLNPKCFPKSI